MSAKKKSVKKAAIGSTTVMIRVFPEDAEWINKEAQRRTNEERLRHTQYSVVRDLIAFKKSVS